MTRIALVLLQLILWFPLASMGQQDVPTTEKPLLSWRTNSGQSFLGSLEAYDVKKKVLTLEGTEGKAYQVAAEKLDGPSKVQWLQAPETQLALQQDYPWQENLSSVLTIVGIVMGIGILFGFLLYWLSVAIVAGDGNFVKAVKSYVLANLGMLLVYVAFGVIVFLLTKFLAENQFMPILAGAFFLLTFLCTIGVFCRVIAKTYEVSGLAGCGVIVIWSILYFVLELAGYFGWPLLMQNPQFDQWLSNLILRPLGLI